MKYVKLERAVFCWWWFCSLWSYLLRGFDTGTGTSRRCPVPRRSPRRWADTGLCCPIWACRPPPPSPSSPGRSERGSGRPDLGLEALVEPCWSPGGCGSWKKARPLSLLGLGFVGGASSLVLPPLALSFTPAERPWKRGWDIYSDLWPQLSAAHYSQFFIM